MISNDNDGMALIEFVQVCFGQFFVPAKLTHLQRNVVLHQTRSRRYTQAYTHNCVVAHYYTCTTVVGVCFLTLCRHIIPKQTKQTIRVILRLSSQKKSQYIEDHTSDQAASATAEEWSMCVDQRIKVDGKILVIDLLYFDHNVIIVVVDHTTHYYCY